MHTQPHLNMWWAINYTHSVSSMKQLPEMPIWVWRSLPSMHYSSSPPRGKCPSGSSTQKILTKQLTCCPKNIFISKNMNYLQHIYYFPFCQAALLQKKSWTQSNTKRANTLICPKQGSLLLLISRHTGTFSCFTITSPEYIQSFKKVKKAEDVNGSISSSTPHAPLT